MNAVERFDFGTATIRSLLVDGEPWFVAVDICRALDLGNTSMAVSGLDEDEKGFSTVDTPGGPQQVGVVNEPGLYSLILRSRKPEAKAFKRWIMHEVLPSIRKTGAYGTPALPSLPEALRRWADEVESREAAERAAAIATARVRELEPVARFAESAIMADGDFSVRAAAQILARDPSIDIGERRLFAELRRLEWLDRSNQPYQRHLEAGRMARKLCTFTDSQRATRTTVQARLTAKGIAELHRVLGGTGSLVMQPELVSA